MEDEEDEEEEVIEEEEEEVEGRSQAAALPRSATSSVAEMMTDEEEEEEEEEEEGEEEEEEEKVTVTTMKKDGEKEEMEEAESNEKNEPPRKEHIPIGAIIEPPRETDLPNEPLTFSTTSDLLIMANEKEEEEEEEEKENVTVTMMKQDAGSEVKSELPRKEDNPPGGIIEPPRETEVPTEPLTFSTTSYPLTSPMFKPGQHVLVCGAERGVVRFVGHTHFKDGVWIGVELERRKTKNDGSIDGKRYFTCSSGYGVFAPVRNVVLLSEEEKEKEWRGGGGGGRRRRGERGGMKTRRGDASKR